ncbi:MAG: hypothetical protein MO846_09620 [Candidatus Devosia symbiotica]|nr:hypothetical protein [Candidatus Devosia symbiotica]
MKQTYKQILTILAFVLPLLGMASFTVHPAQAQSVVTLIVTGPLTGIAMPDMDAVSYFTEPTPLPSVSDYLICLAERTFVLRHCCQSRHPCKRARNLCTPVWRS